MCHTGRCEKTWAAIIGNTTFGDLMSFGGMKLHPHTLVLCDVFIRPHLVIASPHLIGCGASGILTSSDGLGSADAWLEKGKVLINNIPSEHGSRRTRHG